MFATFKKLFGKKVEIAVDSPTDFQPGAVPSAARANFPRPVRVDLQPRTSAHLSNAAVPATVSVPLRSVLSRLPEILMQRVRQLDVGEVEIFIPTEKVLSQIAKGAVKISFGELRQMSPPGTFAPENDRDRVLLDIPLHEILSRLDPALLARRPVQKQVEVPAEVTGPFGGQTKVSFATSVLKAPPAGQPVPLARPQVPVSLAQTPPAPPVAPARPAPAVQPPPQPRVQPVPVARLAVPPVQPAQPIPVAKPIVARIRPAAPTPPSAPAAPAKPASPELPAFSFARIAPQAPAPAPVESPLPEMPPVAFAPVPPARYSAPDAHVAPTPIPEEPEIPVLRRTLPVAEPPLQPVYSPIAPDPEPEPEPIAQVSESFSNLPVSTPISPIATEPEPEPAPIRFNPHFAAETPAPAAPAVPVITGETRFLTISLMELSQAWPEVLLKEIIQQNLSGSLVGLPFGAVEGAIKQGKIAFPWKAIRSWIKPPVPQTTSLHDTAVLELPLKLITPLFLAELKSSRAQKKVAIDDTIPNLFTGSQPLNDAPAVPPPAPVIQARPAPMSAPPTQKPTDTNYFRKEAEEKPQDATVFLRKDGTPATEFLKRYATPNEIVIKAASLPGVEGALIALPDGLLVASRIPPTMNADTIAAFLPQIFGRVSQCTRELRLGDLNNLNFTVGNVPWKIYRVGAIYFAVFGRAGEALPTTQLVGIAAELDRKGK